LAKENGQMIGIDNIYMININRLNHWSLFIA